MLVDTHCHLNFNAFDSDRDIVVKRARKNGVNRILNPGVDIPSSEDAIRLAESYPEVFASVGIHPNESLTWDDSTLKHLKQLAGHPEVVAIGEIGLDYYRNRAPHDHQKLIFEAQLKLASELGLPVIIHTRDSSNTDQQATGDVINILEDWQANLERNDSQGLIFRGVLHSFSGNLMMARKAIAISMMIGITGPVTYPNAKDLRDVVASLQPDQMLIETDAPFLPPQPFRGKRNEPAYVKYVADKIAHIHNKPVGEIIGTTTSNAKRLFNW